MYGVLGKGIPKQYLFIEEHRCDITCSHHISKWILKFNVNIQSKNDLAATSIKHVDLDSRFSCCSNKHYNEVNAWSKRFCKIKHLRTSWPWRTWQWITRIGTLLHGLMNPNFSCGMRMIGSVYTAGIFWDETYEAFTVWKPSVQVYILRRCPQREQ